MGQVPATLFRVLIEGSCHWVAQPVGSLDLQIGFHSCEAVCSAPSSEGQDLCGSLSWPDKPVRIGQRLYDPPKLGA